MYYLHQVHPYMLEGSIRGVSKRRYFMLKCLGFLKPNCREVVLFVIAEEFHKWLNTNEKIFYDSHHENSICSFHGQSREKLK